jgi:hypothetical protein
MSAASRFPTLPSCYDEELARLIDRSDDEGERERYRLARAQSEAMIREGRHDPV